MISTFHISYILFTTEHRNQMFMLSVLPVTLLVDGKKFQKSSEN